jgi:hypothetical protein
VAQYQCGSAREWRQTRTQTQERRLSGSVRSPQRDEFAISYLQIDTSKSRKPAKRHDSTIEPNYQIAARHCRVTSHRRLH